MFSEDTGTYGAWPTTFSTDDKFRVFRILVTSGTISLLPITNIGINQKVQIQEGEDFSTFEYYRPAAGTVLEVVPNITAPMTTLYYQDGTDESRYGVIKILDATTKTIDVDTDIIGKANYTTPNGVVFTNGIHTVSYTHLTLPTICSV